MRRLRIRENEGKFCAACNVDGFMQRERYVCVCGRFRFRGSVYIAPGSILVLFL